MINPKFDIVSTDCKKVYGKMQTACQMRLAIKEEKIDEVLCVAVDSSVSSYSASAGEVTVHGKSNVKALYTSAEIIGSINYNADFSDRFVSVDIEEHSPLYFDIVTLDYKTETDNNIVNLQVLLEITIYTFVRKEFNCLLGGDGVISKMKEISYCNNSKVTDISCDVSSELTAKLNISKILLAESACSIDEYSIKDEVLTMSGKAVVMLTYLVDGNIVFDTLPFGFTHEAEAKGISNDAILSTSVKVKNTKIRLDILEEGENNSFTAELALAVRLWSTEKTSKTIVEDAYSLSGDLLMTSSDISSTEPIFTESVGLSFSGQLAEKTDGEYVAFVGTKAVIVKAEAQEGASVFEGIVCGNLITKRENGYHSKAIELPFSSSVALPATADNVIDATASVSAITIKLTGASCVATIDLLITATGYSERRFSVVSAVTENEIDESTLPAIEVCLAKKGDTLWEMAKGLKMREDDILAINPEIVVPLAKDTKVVKYHKC